MFTGIISTLSVKAHPLQFIEMQTFHILSPTHDTISTSQRALSTSTSTQGESFSPPSLTPQFNDTQYFSEAGSQSSLENHSEMGMETHQTTPLFPPPLVPSGSGEEGNVKQSRSYTSTQEDFPTSNSHSHCSSTKNVSNSPFPGRRTIYDMTDEDHDSNIPLLGGLEMIHGYNQVQVQKKEVCTYIFTELLCNNFISCLCFT